jgi:hypothetical protein
MTVAGQAETTKAAARDLGVMYNEGYRVGGVQRPPASS